MAQSSSRWRHPHITLVVDGINRLLEVDHREGAALAKASRSASVRSRLKHPVIDVDGHVVELTPVYVDYITRVGGHEMAERYLNSPLVKSSYHQSLLGTTIDERRDGGSAMTSWWAAAG